MPDPSDQPMSELREGAARHRLVRRLNDPRFRSFCIQAVVSLVMAAVLVSAVVNTAQNLRKAGIASGFGFLGQVAGFDISQSLVEYSRSSSYGRAFLVGLLNTLVVSGVSIALSSLLGFLVGILRLSPNWLMRNMALVYVEIVRNVPLLLQLLFWYIAILSPLPGPKAAMDLMGAVFLCNRGLIVPRPIFGPGSSLVLIALLLAVASVPILAWWARRRQDLTGERFPIVMASLGIIIGLPLAALAATGFPVRWEIPALQGFNFVGGLTLLPEFTALALGLTLYAAGFIAENVRAGIQAVPRAQVEAARSLGLGTGLTLRLVVIPQAMRVIIPPLTSQHLTLVKNSSLAVVIGYPDLMSVFAGTSLNQTGQAVEIISITMLVYLVISLAISGFMNWYNKKMAIRER